MKTLTKDLIAGSIISNKSEFYVYPGHTVDFVKNPLAAKTGWFSGESLISGNTYGELLYGEELYGNKVARATFVDIQFDLQSIASFDTLGITNANFTAGQVYVAWGNTPDTLDGNITFNLDSELQTYYFKLSPTMLSYRYIRLDFTNSTSAGILKIGNISLGQEYTLPAIAPTYDTGLTSNAYRTITSTRQFYGGPSVLWRALSFTTAPSRTKDELFTLLRTVDVYRPAYWEFDESCLDEAPLYGALTEYSINQFNDEARLYSGRFSLEEAF